MGSFVQYVHSGKEYKITDAEKSAGEKSWNYQPSHRRKFMKAQDFYWDGKSELPADLLFWAEWEPESRLRSTNSNWLRGCNAAGNRGLFCLAEHQTEKFTTVPRPSAGESAVN